MRFSKEEKAMWLEDWQKSGKKAWTYAKENGLTPQTFVGWAKKRSKTKPSFVEIKPQTITPMPQVSEILIEKGDIRIHLPLGLDRRELHAVMEGLRAAL